jgi:polysaccharide deacetylase family protein (PEP-CTERM system associated)
MPGGSTLPKTTPVDFVAHQPGCSFERGVLKDQGSMSRTHVLTVTLEDYFHAPAFRGIIGEKSWSRFETRYEKSSLAALELLARTQSHATFFVGPWLARKCPEILRQILQQGHEVALSGDRGPAGRTMTPGEFRGVVRRGRAIVEDSCGHEVLGYRRSDVLLGVRHLHVLEVLAEEGFVYDSSFSPLAVPFPNEPWRRFIHSQEFATKKIWEVPLSSASFGGVMIPFAGGNYFRQYPEFAVRWFIDNWTRRQSNPLVLYFRLWDLDPEQPRIQTGSLLRNLRHYRHGDQIVRLLKDLFEAYRFNSIAGFLDLHQEVKSEDKISTSQRISALCDEVARPTQRPPVSVIVPCFNEEDSLGYLARSLDELRAELEPGYEVQFIFVDDGSTDSTWQKLNETFGHRPDSLLLRQERNKGVAAAIHRGLISAHEIACSMDCDCSYDPRELKPMLDKMTRGVDMVTASPYHPRGRVANVPRWRIALSRAASLCYRMVTQSRLHTFTSCFRVYRRSVVLECELHHSGFLGIAELASGLALSGRNIVEHPTTLESRLFGASKMKVLRTIGGHLGLLTGLAWSRVTTSNSSLRTGQRVALAPSGSGKAEEELAPAKAGGYLETTPRDEKRG